MQGINFKNAAQSLAEIWCENRAFTRSLPSSLISSHSVKDSYVENFYTPMSNYVLMSKLVPDTIRALPATITVTWSTKATHHGWPFIEGKLFASKHAPIAHASQYAL